MGSALLYEHGGCSQDNFSSLCTILFCACRTVPPLAAPLPKYNLHLQFTCRVPTGERWVVERLGKFSRTLDAGTHGKWPLIESVRSRQQVGPRVQESQLSSVETADGARLSVTLRLELVRFVP